MRPTPLRLLLGLALALGACGDAGAPSPSPDLAAGSGDAGCLFFACTDPRCPTSLPVDGTPCDVEGLACDYYEHSFVCGCDHQLHCTHGTCCGTTTSVCTLPDLGAVCGPRDLAGID